ncbi:MAG: hypothetical protein QOE49_2801 [Rhodospirillaceae bacterium]|nr:hypothetical protein [Rhodospirillaceae bacterium]
MGETHREARWLSGSQTPKGRTNGRGQRIPGKTLSARILCFFYTADTFAQGEVAIAGAPTNKLPFHIRASVMMAAMPIALTTNMPKKAFWPNSP